MASLNHLEYHQLILFDDILETFVAFLSPSSMRGSKRAPSTLTPAEIQIALLELASRDLPLKLLLYQYVILIGLHINTHSTTTKRKNKLYNQIAAANVLLLQDLPALNSFFRGSGTKGIYITKNGVHADAIGKIVDMIVEAVDEKLAVSQSGKTATFVSGMQTNVTRFAIRNALMKIGDPTMPFQKINVTLNEMVMMAYKGFWGTPKNNYFISDKTWRTRFNFIPPAVLVAMMYEIFSSMAIKSGISFKNKTGDTTVHPLLAKYSVKFDINEITALKNAIEQSSAGGSATDVVASSSQVVKGNDKKILRLTATRRSILDNIKSDLTDEEDLIVAITNFIFVYLNHLWTESQDLIKLTKQVKNKKSGSSLSAIERIQNLQKRVDSRDIFAALNPAQVALSVRQAVEIQRSMASGHKNISAFSDPTFLDPAAENLLFSLLREPIFKEGQASNMKIVTVGLPSGLKGSLKSAEIDDEASPGPEKEIDIVKINVFRRDLEFEDIVFKPMSFTFELSRFTAVLPRSRVPLGKRMLGTSNSCLSHGLVRTFNIQVDEDFRWFGGAHMTGTNETIWNVAAASGYSHMSTSEKREMFENHVISYFLNIYLRLLTDIDFRESTFLINNTVSQLKADTNDRKRFLDLMLKRVKQIAGRQISLNELRKTNQQMDILLDKLENRDSSAGVTDKVEGAFEDLSSEANIEIAENIVNFISSFTPDSLLTGADVTSTRMVSPKLFERIFHVPVDLDEFEIDVEATLSTQSGATMFKSKEFQEMIIPTGTGAVRVRGRPSAQGSHILSELFVNLESKFMEEGESEIVSSTSPSLIRAHLEDTGT